MAVLLKTIAEKADVSVSLVSCVVNNKFRNRIKKETWEKVENLAKELNYVPHINAKNLRAQFARNVGICIQEVAYLETPHFMSFLAGIVRALGDFDFDFHICTTADSDKNRNSYYMNKVRSGQVSGLIIEDDLLAKETIVELHKSKTPMVLINRKIKGHNIPYVHVDNESAIYDATKSLVDRGHKRIFLWQSTHTTPNAHEKLLGYMRCLNEANLPLDPELIGRESTDVFKNHKDYHQSEMNRLLNLRNRPTAMVVTTSTGISNIIYHLNANNLQIAEDISLVMMDFADLATTFYPSIHSIHVSAFQIGYQASDLLVKIMKCKQQGTAFEFSEPVVCPYEIIEGNSIKSLHGES